MLDQQLQVRFVIDGPGEKGHMPRNSQLVTTEPERFTETPLDPIALTCAADRPGNKNTIAELLGRLPDKGKKIGRKTPPLVEE